ncbi:xanthine dehydrogenase family protein molybdopterin-binding subunit [Aquincola sp. S2]|uniref:Xanthine dehydrogenase family protein molybdopterin-binding subunit n=1 Tax=Pseudaquabacterium terrae TaxID=2732868 RepID=A0ABX2EET1_9BURK|nr:molybdopterin cofactor-binding domain-containing protein [Aquabacterium terrae]NRF67123.1 xanthine dehydrogenase family protein molybdopterin-binding subunit [Aquabacterium terrae]
MKRRYFVLGTLGAAGALMLGWSLLPVRQRLTPSAPLPTQPGQAALNGWVKVGADDRVTVLLAKSEMGQGIHTALAMLLAEELDADWSTITTEMAPIDSIYNNLATVVDSLPFHPDDKGSVKRIAGWMTAKSMREIGIMATGGSSSIKDLWGPMREAGASARAMLVGAAAQAWGVPAAEIEVRSGVLRHAASGKQSRFGAFAEAAARQPLPSAPVLKDPARFTLIGQPQRRLESASKGDGSARFAIDQLPPGLLYASVRLCPTLGGRASGFDDKAARALPGFKQALMVPALRGGTAGVAVIADTPWHAMQAVKALDVQWDPGPAAGLSTPTLMQQLAAALDRDNHFTYHDSGDTAAALQAAAKTIDAEYRAPPLAHSTLEPQNCTVLLRNDGSATVWAPTQVPDFAIAAAAEAMAIPKERIRLEIPLLGGGFGRRLEVDFIAQAAAIARALPDKPVQTFWSREEDMTHDFYRPPAVARYRAGFDAQGKPVAFSAVSAAPSIVHQVVKRQFGLPGAGPDKTTAEGAFDQPYEWPNARIGHAIVDVPLPVGFWRSVGHSHNAFFKEGFVDEMAVAAGQDPLAFRVSLLQNHPRHLQVLQRAASLAGWGAPLADTADGAKQARGIALHESFGSVVAQVAEVSLAADKRIRVHRVVAVIDCGFPVNPNGVRQQMESAIVFGLSAALYGEITLDKGQVQQHNFHEQPMLRYDECPAIETEIVASTAAPEGVGEPGTPPIAPAVANALFALTGQRLRTLPLKLT